MKKLFAALLISAVSTGSWADAYYGVNFGRAEYEFDIEPSTGIGLFLGNRINENFAVELGYLDLGRTVDSEDLADIQTKTVSVTARLIAETFDDIEVFLAVGAHSWELEVADFFGTIKLDDQDALYGAGIQFELDSDVYAALEFIVYKMDELDLKLGAFKVQFEF